MPMAAMAGISAGSSLLGGLMGKNAAGAAADAMGKATTDANNKWAQENQRNQDMNQPYLDLGSGAAGSLGYLLGTGKNDPNLAGGTGGGYGSLMHTFGASDFQTDPGYQFRLQQGQQALERSAAAKGNLTSGGTAKAEMQYGQGFASNEYGNAFNRYMQDRASKYGMLTGATQIGQHSADTMTGANDDYAKNFSSNLLGGTQAANDYRLSGTAALTNGINGGLNSLQQMLMMRSMGGGATSVPQGPSYGNYGVGDVPPPNVNLGGVPGYGGSLADLLNMSPAQKAPTFGGGY